MRKRGSGAAICKIEGHVRQHGHNNLLVLEVIPISVKYTLEPINDT